MGKTAIFWSAVMLTSSTLTGLVDISSAQGAERQWVWSSTSGAVNQSTEALADGRYAHAIRFANAALRGKTNDADHLLARQNLCLAWLARSAQDKAQPFCDAVMDSQAGYVIVEQNGRWLVTDEIADENVASRPTLGATMRANITYASRSAVAESQNTGPR